MNVNGVMGYSQLDAYSTYQSNVPKAVDKTETVKAEEPAAVYEKSDIAATYTPNTSVVDMLKADAAAQEASLRDMVQKLISGQGNALATADDFWRFLASGNFTVTQAAKEEAQKAISEDGYWGVNQTSDRIIEMAKALTGGDPSKIDAMRDAFEKGFKEATKTWGQDLPDISSKTRDAVLDKFDKWAEESAEI
ncbi:MAG: hypothetical protein IKS87_07705 [Lachnospiraceae bacterium]|nr:hypothetical protein [Lachnospiraceae bacterium]